MRLLAGPEVTPDGRDAAYRLRVAVFVGDQGVPADLELDEADGTAEHVVVLDAAGEAVATGRLVRLGGARAQVGRMAVRRGDRGVGLGAQVLAALAALAAAEGVTELVAHAQTSALGFYERAGWTPYGPVFTEAGITHREVRRRLG